MGVGGESERAIDGGGQWHGRGEHLHRQWAATVAGDYDSIAEWRCGVDADRPGGELVMGVRGHEWSWKGAAELVPICDGGRDDRWLEPGTEPHECICRG